LFYLFYFCFTCAGDLVGRYSEFELTVYELLLIFCSVYLLKYFKKSLYMSKPWAKTEAGTLLRHSVRVSMCCRVTLCWKWRVSEVRRRIEISLRAGRHIVSVRIWVCVAMSCSISSMRRVVINQTRHTTTWGISRVGKKALAQAQTPLLQFVVDLLNNKLCIKFHSKL